MGYLSVGFVLILIKEFNASVAEAVKSAKRVITVVISFVVFSRPISGMHVLGFILFCFSVGLGLHQKLTPTVAPSVSPEMRCNSHEGIKLLGEPEPLDIGSNAH